MARASQGVRWTHYRAPIAHSKQEGDYVQSCRQHRGCLSRPGVGRLSSRERTSWHSRYGHACGSRRPACHGTRELRACVVRRSRHGIVHNGLILPPCSRSSAGFLVSLSPTDLLDWRGSQWKRTLTLSVDVTSSTSRPTTAYADASRLVLIRSQSSVRWRTWATRRPACQ